MSCAKTAQPIEMQLGNASREPKEGYMRWKLRLDKSIFDASSDRRRCSLSSKFFEHLLCYGWLLLFVVYKVRTFITCSRTGFSLQTMFLNEKYQVGPTKIFQTSKVSLSTAHRRRTMLITSAWSQQRWDELDSLVCVFSPFPALRYNVAAVALVLHWNCSTTSQRLAWYICISQ